MAEVIKLTDKYIDASDIYDVNQSKTQQDINSSVNSSIQSMNSNLSTLNKIQCVGSGKHLYVYSKWVDNASSTNITITSTNGYQVLTGFIFTRYAILSFRINCDVDGNYSLDSKSAVLGSDPLTWSVSGKTVTMTIGAWESFTMIFNSHNNSCPTFA